MASGFVARNYGLEDSAEIERMFIHDIRDKKKAGRGIFSKTGKGGDRAKVRGGVRFAGDSLKGKEKKEYRGTGKVRAYNMNDFIPKEAFLQLSEDDQRKRLTHWRDNYSNTEIMEGCGFNKNDIYDFIARLNIPKKTRKTSGIQEIEMEQAELEKVKKDPSQLYNWDRFKALPISQRDEVIFYWTEEKKWQAADLADIITDALPKDLHQASWTARDRRKKREKKEQAKNAPNPIKQEVKEQPETIEERAERLKEAKPKQEQTSFLTFEEVEGTGENMTPKAPAQEAPAQPNLYEFLEQFKQLASTAMEPKAVEEPQTHGFYFTQNGEFLASELERRLQNAINIIHGSGAKYELKLELKEIEAAPAQIIEQPKEETTPPILAPAKGLAEAFAELGSMLNKSFNGGQSK